MRKPGSVATYYDENSARFLRTKKDRARGSIHRMLYAPGISSRDQALEYVNALVLNEVLNCRPSRVLDLGCGVGGTIRYLQRSYPAEYTGITISETQVKIGREFGTRLEHADFLDPQWYARQEVFQLIYAIESVQHNPDHNRLLENLRMITEKGACFLVIDDFLHPADSGSRLGSNRKDSDERLVERFKKSWHAFGFTPIADLKEVCAANGFKLEEMTDLSGYMRNSSVWNRIQLALSFLLRLYPSTSSWIENILGGNALKLMQERGISGYYKLLFRRT